MDYSQIFAISAAGMAVERRRLEVATLNVANARTITGVDGQGYRPQRVVVQAVAGTQADGPAFMPAATVEATGAPDRKVYEPENPFADAQGFISYPGVDNLSEMMSIMSAVRAYEANVAAMNAARSMALKALDIGGGA